MKVVLDTNVLISGIFFSGPPDKILKAWRNGEVQFVLSSEIIDEYVKVSRILANRNPKIEINSIINLIIASSEIVQTRPLACAVCEDPDDDKFLACALASGTNIIISGDKHLLKLSGYQGISILPPRAFLEQYLKN